MTHSQRQPIPLFDVPPPTAIPMTTWFLLFEAAKQTKSFVGVHQDETSYHSEPALRAWAQFNGMKLEESEQRNSVTGDRYINLILKWPGQFVQGIVLYKIRELVRIDEGDDDVPDADDMVDDEEAMELPDSNETLGINQGSAEY